MSQSPPQQFLNVPISDLIVGEFLPCAVYLFLDQKFVVFRGAGDRVDRDAYDRLELKKVPYVFILATDLDRWKAWVQLHPSVELLPEPDEMAFRGLRDDVRREAMDIFQSSHPQEHIRRALSTSRKLVLEVMRAPFAVKTLAQIHRVSRGTVDHSVNVSILSTYLAMQMGYSHQMILQHVGVAGLVHDIGKLKVPIGEEDTPAEIETKMRQHPELGAALLERMPEVAQEVRMIVLQHHECYDGSGFPKKLRGKQIYDLARIVGIANYFDELVSNHEGPLLKRQKDAVTVMETVDYKKFDPEKLEKAVKVLRLGV